MYKIIIGINLCLLTGCYEMEKVENISSVSWEYPGDAFFLKGGQVREGKCNNVMHQTITVNVEHENIKHLSAFKMRISIGGTVYLDKYMSEVLIEEITFCENERNNISVQLIDKSNVAYNWTAKESYTLCNVTHVKLLLKADSFKDGSNLLVMTDSLVEGCK